MGVTNSTARRRNRRLRLYKVQGGRCAHCFRPMAKTSADIPGDRATIDHVFPKSAGGRLLRNTVVVHARCNEKKSGRPPTGCELIVLAWVQAAYERRYPQFDPAAPQ